MFDLLKRFALAHRLSCLSFFILVQLVSFTATNANARPIKIPPPPPPPPLFGQLLGDISAALSIILP